MQGTLAVQLYMVRDRLNTQKDAAETLKKIRESGCDSVEMVGAYLDRKIDWKGLLSDAGLTCCSSHEPYPDMLGNFPEIISRMHKLACHDVVIAMPSNVDFSQMDQVKQFADELNHLGEQYKREGMRLHYHNHGMEFARPNDELCAYQYLAENTDPTLLRFQPDIFWIQLGGASPEDWVRRLSGRMSTIHLKDFVIAGGTPAGQERLPVCTELGRGNLPMGAIMETAHAAGVQTYILEVHDNWIGNDPLESVRICAERYRELWRKHIDKGED